MSRLREISRLARRIPAARGILELGDPQRRARFLAASGLIDPELYARQLGRPAISTAEAADHYARVGFTLGYTINPLIDPETLGRHLMRTWRPIIYDYLNSRSWSAQVSPIWDIELYGRANPDAAEHRSGPVGHLWDRLRSGQQTTLDVTPGGERQLAWADVRESIIEAVAQSADHRRRKLNRLPTPERSTPLDSTGSWPDGVVPPLVSIIVPVWNRAGALRDALDSVLAQRWENWELIVVDDGSWDDSVRIAETVAARDARVRVVHGSHAGVSAARNTGIEIARGDFIAFLDSDNTWQPGFLHDVMVATQGASAEAAYATIALVRGNETVYRDAQTDFDSLLESNSIDLNTFVVSKRVIDEVGGFDPALARAVDYDVILKVARLHRPLHVPTLGAVYDDSEESADRISNAEALGWNTKVRLRHDPAVSAGTPSLQGGAESFVLVQGGDLRLGDKLQRAAEQADETGTTTTMVLLGLDAGQTARCAVAALGRPAMRIRVYDADEPFAYVVNRCAAEARHERFVMIDPRGDARTEAVQALAAAVAEKSVVAAIPRSVAADGTLLGVGAACARPKSIPHLLLAEHPSEDAPGEPTAVPLLTGRSFAARTADFRAVGGLDPLFFNAFELEALTIALREQHRGDVAFVPAAYIWHPDRTRAFARTDRRGNARRIRELTAHVEPGDVVYAAAGLEVTGWSDPRSSAEGEPASEWDPSAIRPVPVVRRVRRTTTVDGETVPVLRWAIKIAAPSGPRGEVWGDTHFANALARALREIGQDAVVDHREAFERRTRDIDDVDLVIRGLDQYEPRASALSMLWVISHPDDVTKSEASAYDAVFAASLPWARSMTSRWGVQVEPLLQCTDPGRFHPSGAPRSADLVFVGNSRWVPRPAVVQPVRHGVDVKVYGDDWEPFIPKESVVARHVDNAQVGALYGRAGAVLNDHWSDMRREGFIANRLFDVVAAGGRAISDDVEGLEELFGKSVFAFRSVDALLSAVTGDLDSLFASEPELEEISERIRTEHSFTARARVLLDAARARI